MHDTVLSGSVQQARSKAEIYATPSAMPDKSAMVLSAMELVLVAQPSADPSASEKVSFVTLSCRLL